MGTQKGNIYKNIVSMGRRKLDNIQYIEDDRLRQITYCKRKKGLIKKAMEISILCGIKI